MLTQPVQIEVFLEILIVIFQCKNSYTFKIISTIMMSENSFTLKVENNTKFERFLRILLIATAIGAFTDFFDSAIIGADSGGIEASFHIGLTAFGLIASESFIGGIAGAFLFGWMADKIGRKRSFIIDLIVFVVAEILGAITTTALELNITRFFVGVGIGGDFAPAFIMLSEYYPKMNRGRSYMAFMVIYSLGGFGAYIIGAARYGLPITLWWRYLFLIGAIPPAIGILIRARIPEPPRWFLLKGRVEMAKKAMDTIGLSSAKENMDFLMKNHETTKGRSSASLIKPYLWVLTIPLIFVAIGNFIPATGAGPLTPIFVGGLGVSGRNTLLFSAVSVGIVQASGAAVVYFVIDKIGQFKVLSLGMALSALGLFVSGLTVGHLYISFAFYLLWTFSLPFAVGTLWALPTQLYPSRIRGIGEGINIAVSRGIGIVGVYGGTVLYSSVGARGLFWVYAGTLTVGLLIFVFAIGKKVEPLGKELEDIVGTYIN